MDSAPGLKGRFLVRIRDKHGRLKKELVAFNGIVNVGKDLLLGVMFNAQSPSTTWYVGLINAAGFVELADDDTMADHSWNESPAYDEATRPEWPEDAPANQQIANSSKVIFTINGTHTVRGFFLVNDNVKGDSAGILWSAAVFVEGDQGVAPSDTIELTYVLSAAGD